MIRIPPGKTDVSIPFGVSQAGLDVTEFRYSYTRWNMGDGTSWATVTRVITAELASLNTAHTDDNARYIGSTATDGNQFEIRVDVVDDVCAVGADFVTVSLYDDSDNELSQQVIKLRNYEGNVYGGSLHFDDSASNSNSVVDFDGTPSNPVSDPAALETLITNTGIRHIMVKGLIAGSNEDFSNCTFESIGLSGRVNGDSDSDFSFSRLKGMRFSGDFTPGTANTDIEISDSVIEGNVTCVNRTLLKNCVFRGGNNIFDDVAGDVISIVDCKNVSNSPVNISGGSDGDFNIVGWKGNITLQNINNVSQLIELHIQGGLITIDSSCTDGTIRISGWGKVTDTSAGSTVITSDFQPLPDSNTGIVTLADSTTNKDIVAEGVWDSNRGDHVTSGTFGENVLSDMIKVAGQSNIDGTALNTVLEYVQAMFNGRFEKNTPSVGKITFYKRDNTSVLSVVDVTTTSRTRDS